MSVEAEMGVERRPLLLLDTASLYFRAFYGVPSSVRAPDGSPVNAVRGLLEMIARLVVDHRPGGLVCCWDDDWRPAFRVAAIPSYKAHRLASGNPADGSGVPGDGGPSDGGHGSDGHGSDGHGSDGHGSDGHSSDGHSSNRHNGDGPTGAEAVPAELASQVPVIVELLAALGLARVGAPGFEADDVIATLATRTDGPVDVVTGDRDLFQLVDDAAGVRVLYTVKGIRNLRVVDQAELAARYGVPDGRAYADLAVLRGDPSDGLPGVPGIGEKTAAALVLRYGSVAGVLAAAVDDTLAPGPAAKVRAAADYLAVAPRVVEVVRDVPLADVDTSLPHRPVDPDRLATLAARWGIGSSVRRLTGVLAARSDT